MPESLRLVVGLIVFCVLSALGCAMDGYVQDSGNPPETRAERRVVFTVDPSFSNSDFSRVRQLLDKPTAQQGFPQGLRGIGKI